MLQQQEAYQQQLAALHALVEAQMILEFQNDARAGGASNSFHAAAPQLPAGPAATHAAQHVVFPATVQSQHASPSAPPGFAAQVGRMQIAPAPAPQWHHQPHQHTPPQLPRPQLEVPTLDHGGLFDDLDALGGPTLQQPGGGLFTWHEEVGDVIMEGAAHELPPLTSRRNSWDPPIAMPTDGRPPLPSAATWDAQLGFKSVSPLRKRQALEPCGMPGQVGSNPAYPSKKC